LGRTPHIILSLCFSVAAVPWPLAPASLLCSPLPWRCRIPLLLHSTRFVRRLLRPVTTSTTVAPHVQALPVRPKNTPAGSAMMNTKNKHTNDTRVRIGWDVRKLCLLFLVFSIYNGRARMAQLPARSASSTSAHDAMPGRTTSTSLVMLKNQTL
jgi:hypothetical protein